MNTLNIQIKRDNKTDSKYMIAQGLHIVGERLVKLWTDAGGKW